MTVWATLDSLARENFVMEALAKRPDLIPGQEIDYDSPNEPWFRRRDGTGGSIFLAGLMDGAESGLAVDITRPGGWNNGWIWAAGFAVAALLIWRMR
jgi:hypothetical protein